MAKTKGKGGKPPVKGGRTTAKTAARNVGTANGGAPPARATAKPTAKATRPAKDATTPDATAKAVPKGKPVKPAATPGLANKGGDRVGSGPRPKPAPTKRTTPTPSARYTPPIPKSEKVSPLWVPILMFACLGLGMAIIILNYVNVLPGDEPSNVYLMIGLGLITIGFVTATKYH